MECQHYLHNNPEFNCPECEHDCYGGYVTEKGEEKECAICGTNLRIDKDINGKCVKI